MQLIRGLHNLANFTIKQLGTVVTIGNFDGIHLGHQIILNEVKNTALALDCASVVIFFEPQPREFFAKDNAPIRISLLQDKLRGLFSIDFAVCLKFNKYLADLSAQDFVDEILVKRLKVKHLIIGNDFCFGKNRTGNLLFLREQGLKHAFAVTVCEEFTLNNARISSTRLRSELANCNFALVKQMLGRSFSLTRCVIHGNKLARTLGFPTANLNLFGKKLPFNGVFAVKVQIANIWYNAVANVGVRPSVSDDLIQHLEVHILNFNADLYGRKITVSFLHKIRNEQKFTNLDELKKAVFADINLANDFFMSNTNVEFLDY